MVASLFAGFLFERGLYIRHAWKKRARIIKAGVTIDDDLDLIYAFELAGMLGDPEKLRRRLVRFFDSGVNWDEAKPFLFKDIAPPPPHWQAPASLPA